MSVISAIKLAARANLGFIAIGLVWGSIAAQLPVLKAQVGAGDAVFGLLLMASAAGLFTTMWLAPLFDKRFNASALPMAAVLIALIAVLPGLATSPASFFFVMISLGFGSGLLDIISNARVAEMEAEHGRSLMNASHGVFSVAYATSAVCTGLAREAGFGPLPILSVVCLIILCLSLKMRLPSRVDLSDESDPGPMPHRAVLLCGAVVLLAFFVEATVESWSALHIERTLGGRAAEGALGPAVLGLTMAFGRFFGQSISERLREQPMITGGALLAAIGAILAASAPAPAMAYLGFGIMGLGVAVIGPMALGMVARLVPPIHRTKAVARAAVIGFSAFVWAPAFMGLTAELFGLRVAFAMVAGLALLTPILSHYALASRARQTQSP